MVKVAAEITDGARLLTPRAPNEAERAKLMRRLERLHNMEDSISKATANMVLLAVRKPRVTELRIRESFVRRGHPAPGDYSDRRVPPRHLRPPSTRLVSSNGVALRVILTALFEAQTSAAKAGTHPVNTRPLRGTREVTGWIDLVASPAQHSPRGSVGSVTINDKKLRQLDDTLVRLAAAELVVLPNSETGAGKREGFELLDEGGQREQGPNDRYLLPKSDEKGLFYIPVALFTQGWVHCLEDTELALLLLLSADGARETFVKIEGDDRLRYCGLGRDAYEAHIMLNRLGLITVQPDPKRYADGKVENYNEEGAYLHAFRLSLEGFDRPAYSAVSSAISAALEQIGVA